MLRRLVLAAATLAVLAPSAQAAPPGINIGTTSGNTGRVEPADVAEAARLGAKSFRIFVDWADFQPSPAAGPLPERTRSLVASVSTGRQAGLTPVLVVLHAPSWANGSSDRAVPPTDPQSYANFVAFLARELAAFDPVWEVWNEMDEGEFWRGAPQPVRYAGLLKATKRAVDAVDPEAQVIFGALTGNNYTFFEQTWDQGGLTANDLDGVALHTDTACLVRPPDFYVRNVGTGLDGRINRFSFLGFREVQASMEARGVGDKGIYMTELGWSTFTGPCELPGVEAGRLGGVSPAQQAANITMAYRCMANYSYVKQALVFDLRDRGAGRTAQYGVLGKPAEGAFRAVPDDGGPGGECGDFTAPTVTPIVPVTEFTGPLKIQARATDASGVTRITMKVDGKEIRNFTGDDVGNDKVVGLDPWDGAKNLSTGEHTLTFEAIDAPSNLGQAEVRIRKVDPAKVSATNRTSLAIRSIRVRRGKGQIKATLTKAGGTLELKGKIDAVWETKRPRRVKGKRKLVWVPVHKQTTSVKIVPTGKAKTVTFRSQALKYKRYRVKLTFKKSGAYLASQTGFRTATRR